MQRQLLTADSLAAAGRLDQLRRQLGSLTIFQTPAHHTTAEDVDDDVQIEQSSLLISPQLGDVPAPDLVGCGGGEPGTGRGGEGGFCRL